MITLNHITHIGIHKIVTRTNPYVFETIEHYRPAATERKTLKQLTRRSLRRKATIKLDNPITHEIHFTHDSIAKTLEYIGEPNTDIATAFTIHNIKETINRRNNTGCILHNNIVYFVLTWNDVLYNPMTEKVYTGPEQTKRKLNRCKYPMGQLRNTKKNRLVYYLQQTTPQEQELIIPQHTLL